MAEAVRDGLNRGSPGYPAYEQAQAALAAAEQLHDADELADGRLLLLRTGVMLLGRAALVRAGEAEDTPPPRLGGADFELGCAALRAAERLSEFDGDERGVALLHAEIARLFARAPLPVEEPPNLTVAELSEGERERLVAVTGADGLGYLATLSADERGVTARLLERVAGKIGAPLRAEAARVRRIHRSRWLRIGITLAALLTLLVVLVPGSPKNLALGQPVTTSSTYVSGDTRYDPKGLVDGDTKALGFHTNRGGSQWAKIDLGTEQKIHSVVVFNRTNCCSANAVPLRIELSTDGKNYREVAKRTTDFTVWNATFSATKARYVRLTCTSGEYFHLVEVQVY
jgi:hypothetical protein